MIRIWTSDLSYRNELFWGLPILYSLSVIVVYFYNKFSKEKITEYIFFDDYIIERRTGKSDNHFYLENLKSIEFDEAKDGMSPISFLKLRFAENKKLYFSSMLPKFTEIRKYLKSYLSDRIDLDNYMKEGDKL